MRLVVALGGNALLQRGERPDAAVQLEHVKTAAVALAGLAREHEVVITHGNGPQIGVLALESANDPALERPYPLDTLGAQTQGMIGYWLMQALKNELPQRDIACCINQTLVAADDPAFATPTKFVGQVYDRETALRLAQQRGWVMKPDGKYYRRVVGSPLPQEIVELPLIRAALKLGTVMICAGGGGIPVIRNEKKQLVGVEAVIDKDLTAARLALDLAADALLILTDVAGVYRNFGEANQQLLRELSLKQCQDLQLPSGSMEPKVNAACEFVSASGGFAAIGSLHAAQELVEKRGGTIISV